MRLSTALTLMLGLSVSACTQDTTPTIYVDVAYQIRCLDCDPRGPDDPAHKIKVVDGEDDYALECSVKRVSGTRRASFTIRHLDPKQSSSNHVLKLTSVSIDGPDDTAQCELKIVEGANSYEGPCGGGEPSVDQPCQASFTVKDGVIRGGVYCANIPNASNLTITRYLVAPGERTEKAPISIYGCQGL